MVYDRESGRSRGFGFVTMSSEAEMSEAIANLDGQVMCTHIMTHTCMIETDDSMSHLVQP